MATIEERAYKAYPENHPCDYECREGFRKACEEYESLPKIRGWIDYVDRSNDFGPIFYTDDGEIRFDIPDINNFDYSGKPIAVELIIRKV